MFSKSLYEKLNIFAPKIVNMERNVKINNLTVFTEKGFSLEKYNLFSIADRVEIDNINKIIFPLI